METSLKATEKATIDAEEGTEVHEVPARSLSEPLECLCMGKQMRWLVGFIETDKSTEAVFDLLWPWLDKGERRLSVRRGVDRRACIFSSTKPTRLSWSLSLSPRRSALRLCTSC